MMIRVGGTLRDAASDRGLVNPEGQHPSTASTRAGTIPVSVIVMTKDEERNLPECLASLGRFGEVFVVDSGSRDRTPEIARESGASLINFQWNRRYPKKKQWCLENLPFTHTWVLYVDADERVTEELALEIERVIGDRSGRLADYSGFYVAEDYVFLGRTLRYGHRTHKLVLHDRRRSHFPDYDDLDADNMWEVEGHYQPIVKGRVGTLRAHLIHNDCSSLYEYFARHNRYSDWEAVLNTKGAQLGRAQAQAGARTHAARLFAMLPLKPLTFFLYSYVLKRGFLDGAAGFHYALAKSFYYWQIGVKTKERALASAERVD